jgi:hypothetical protein
MNSTCSYLITILDQTSQDFFSSSSHPGTKLRCLDIVPWRQLCNEIIAQQPCRKYDQQLLGCGELSPARHDSVTYSVYAVTDQVPQRGRIWCIEAGADIGLNFGKQCSRDDALGSIGTGRASDGGVDVLGEGGDEGFEVWWRHG